MEDRHFGMSSLGGQAANPKCDPSSADRGSTLRDGQSRGQEPRNPKCDPSVRARPFSAAPSSAGEVMAEARRALGLGTLGSATKIAPLCSAPRVCRAGTRAAALLARTLRTAATAAHCALCSVPRRALGVQQRSRRSARRRAFAGRALGPPLFSLALPARPRRPLHTARSARCRALARRQLWPSLSSRVLAARRGGSKGELEGTPRADLQRSNSRSALQKRARATGEILKGPPSRSITALDLVTIRPARA